MIGRLDGRAHALVADLAAPELEPDDEHHLTRVLRLRPDEVITLTDGRGSWCPARIVAAGGARAVEPVGPVITEVRPEPQLTVAFAPVKGDRPEWVVQKLTELGVDRIVPVSADRSVVRWEGERATRQLERLARVAREAVMQSRSVWLPEVGWRDASGSLVVPRASTLFAAGAAAGDQFGDPLDRGCRFVVVGPEGGWSPEELAGTSHRVKISAGVLRSETAAITLGGVLTAVRGGFLT